MLDEEKSERGKHALKRLADMCLAAVVHLPDFNFVFVPLTQNSESSLLGLIKPSKVKDSDAENIQDPDEAMNEVQEV